MTDRLEILATGLKIPSGPTFDHNGNLWCVELGAGNLVSWSGGHLHRYAADGAPSGLAFDRRGRLCFCDGQRNGVPRFHPQTGEWDTIADTLDGQPLNKPNDLAFDGAGNLTFTCPGDSRTEPTGYVCCLRSDETLRKIADGMYFPNGLAFADQGRTLIVAETRRQRLWKGSWNENAGEWVKPPPWADVGGPNGPDGMAVGMDGLVYVAVYGSGQIKAVDSGGEIVRTFDLPGRNPTNVAFDPSRRWGLVVTEAERGLLLSLPGLGPGVELFDGGEAWP